MSTDPHTQEHRVPFTRFAIVNALELAAVVGLFAWLAPAVFRAELAQPWNILLWIIILGIPLSLFEYIYHRYLLHSAILPFMASMHRAHSTHHGLTSVKAPVTPKEPAKMVEVRSEYPVEEEHQEESMMFPLYSLPIFYGLFFVLLGLPLKAIFPAQPIYLALILSVTLYYCFYEVWHAILHLPFERFWKPALEGKFTKKVAGYMYGFHLMHHWRPTTNVAIVGFWGIALWDHVFRTHARPERLPLNKAQVNYSDARINKPLWPISMLDGWQGKMYKWSRSVEASLAKRFLGRKSSS